MDNLGNICSLIGESGGEVYQTSLTVGLYALSKGSVDQKIKNPLFDYEFDSLGPFGMLDKRFELNLHTLDFANFIELSRERCKLTDDGKTLAIISLCNLDSSQKKYLKEVANDLRYDMKLDELLVKYAPKWSRKAVEKLNQMGL